MAPGIPTALGPHTLFSTDDPASAERLGAPLFGRHRLVPADHATGAFHATLHALVTGALTLGHLQLRAATRLELSGAAPRFLVVQPTRGPTSVRCGAVSFDVTPDRALVSQPGQAATMLCPADAGYLVVGIEQQAMTVHLGRLLNRAPDRALAFSPELDLAAAAASRWNLAVEMLQAELCEHGSLLQQGIGHSQLDEFLMSSLLFGHRSSFSDVLTRSPRSPERRTTTLAKDFIEVNLSERLILTEVAAAAGVSVRTLETAFRSDLRTTPSAFIRSRRLDRARADLVDAARRDTQTVTDVATRWGISHLGRFAAEYRARFGESPSQTLRRPSS